MSECASRAAHEINRRKIRYTSRNVTTTHRAEPHATHITPGQHMRSSIGHPQDPIAACSTFMMIFSSPYVSACFTQLSGELRSYPTASRDVLPTMPALLVPRRRYLLATGDSLRYPGDVPHRWRVVGVPHGCQRHTAPCARTRCCPDRTNPPLGLTYFLVISKYECCVPRQPWGLAGPVTVLVST